MNSIWEKIQTPRPNTTPNTNPGPPVSWNDPTNPDDPQAGYGYIANDTTKEETFFYHSDHLGSTSYITDDHANITQYDAYLPYGELLVDERYQYNPQAKPGSEGGMLNPAKRKVTQKDIDHLKIGLMVKCTPERGHNALFFIPLQVFIML